MFIIRKCLKTKQNKTLGPSCKVPKSTEKKHHWLSETIFSTKMLIGFLKQIRFLSIQTSLSPTWKKFNILCTLAHKVTATLLSANSRTAAVVGDAILDKCELKLPAMFYTSVSCVHFKISFLSQNIFGHTASDTSGNVWIHLCL